MLLRTFAAALLAGLVFPAVAAGWGWPVSGDVITPYRNGDDPYAAGQHRGIDIGAAPNTPVRAAAAGTVTFAGVAGSSGLTVAVRTGDGRFDTSYLHLSSAAVVKGDRVGEGARLGLTGTTGRRSAAQPHLHFGVREAGSRHAYRDPLTLLPPPVRPVREAPRAVPVGAPAPVRAAPRRERVPRADPVRRRVPAGRRVRVPAARPSPRRVPARPVLGPRPVTPSVAPDRVGGRVRAPRLGPRPVVAPAPAPTPAHRVEREPVASGPDLGMALACVGLLLAAACVGGRPGGSAERRLSPVRGLRLLAGRR